MIADNDMPKGIKRWQELEGEMVRLYRDHKRKLEEIARLENIPENVVLRMRLQNGGVDQPLRVATGAKWWLTERAARKNAASHTYIALHRAKLVNDHFLPLTPERRWRDVAGAPPVLTSKIAIEPIIDLWKQRAVSTGHKLYRSRMRISQNGKDRSDLAMILTTPVQFPATEPLKLFWDNGTNVVVSLHSLECFSISPAELQLMRETTFVLLSSARTKVPRNDAVGAPNVLVSPDIPLDELET
ncbi:hypothetical protein BDV33DRAFT_210813 [Aspergillus novoparasiticus]|uniref:Dicer dsRNA-binding fold domain-containing protein n=1 Tax=Aspergillus novoparasiticus TaxID=986946 RepID=A0A5N6E5I4_9EURO|nr:hypothetical protein BDV33DRAFT_210813 [Aspergillus novoparasiticus]